MAYLDDLSTFPENVYKLNTTDPVVGGTPVFDNDGITPLSGYSNAQAQVLANRTRYLKGQVDTINAQLAAPDPFPTYIKVSEKGEPDGVCDLDETGLIPIERIPPLSVGEVNTASNIGTGAGLFAQKMGENLEFKSIVAGKNTSVTFNGTEITINASLPLDGVPGMYFSSTTFPEGLYSSVVYSDDFGLTDLGEGVIGVDIDDVIIEIGTKLDATATAVNSSKLENQSLAQVVAATQPFSNTPTLAQIQAIALLF